MRIAIYDHLEEPSRTKTDVKRGEGVTTIQKTLPALLQENLGHL